MQSPPEQSPYLSVERAARYLGLKRRTLDNMRWSGGGPKYRKHGGRVLYHIEALENWSKSREYASTSGA